MDNIYRRRVWIFPVDLMDRFSVRSTREQRRGKMKTPKIETIYRLAIGAVLLLVGLFAEMSTGAKGMVFLIAALAFVEAYFKAPGKDPYGRETAEHHVR
jgi:hypothetical protein